MTPSHIQDVLRKLGSEYTDGYGPTRIPNVIDEEVSELLVVLSELDARARVELVETVMTEAHGFVLIAYAERMASLAVRESRLSYVDRALDALSFATQLVYTKEVLPVVSLLYRSVQKTGFDIGDVFAKKSKDLTAKLREFLEDFVKRTEVDRSIEAMGYIEGSDTDGFRYLRTW